MYDTDFFEWTKEQSKLIRSLYSVNIDIENIAEEIESLGNSNKLSMQSHLTNLLMHKLKVKYQPEMQLTSNSWNISIGNAFDEIETLVDYSPSLKRELIEVYDKSYQYARKKAARETRLPIEKFPETCPWAIEEIFPQYQKSYKD